MPDNSFVAQVKGYSLTTAEILYRLPDHPSLLQTFIWQDYDLHPKYPKLYKFLNFWRTSIEGALFQVRVAHQGLIQPAELKCRDGEFLLH